MFKFNSLICKNKYLKRTRQTSQQNGQPSFETVIQLASILSNAVNSSSSASQAASNALFPYQTKNGDTSKLPKTKAELGKKNSLGFNFLLNNKVIKNRFCF